MGARFTALNGVESVADYGDLAREYQALRQSAGLIDLSCRGRLCLVGDDRQRFLNGQVTNNLKDLPAGRGCYAALVNAKGKIQSDLNIHVLPDEILLDFEPGLSETVTRRLDHYIIADDVRIVDVSSTHGLLSVQGPRAADVLGALNPPLPLPVRSHDIACVKHERFGELYVVNLPRGTVAGFDLFLPVDVLQPAMEQLIQAARSVEGRPCGWTALETVRIESGIPRFGADMDETNLAPEAGLEERAISYSKGCYIGQEVIARIRTYGQVAKSLRGLELSGSSTQLPGRGDKLIHDGKEVGHITSAVHSPALGRNIALGYVRKEVNQPGTTLIVRTPHGEETATIVPLPFAKANSRGQKERRG
jgi:folate-binding protein YgfZ